MALDKNKKGILLPDESSSGIVPKDYYIPMNIFKSIVNAIVGPSKYIINVCPDATITGAFKTIYDFFGSESVSLKDVILIKDVVDNDIAINAVMYQFKKDLQKLTTKDIEESKLSDISVIQEALKINDKLVLGANSVLKEKILEEFSLTSISERVGEGSSHTAEGGDTPIGEKFGGISYELLRKKL